MTDNEIKKALECSPLNDIGGCRKIDALDLIKCQKAEVERLNIRNKALTAITKNYDWKFEKAKSEAIKEFAERLKEHSYTHSDICGYKSTVIDVECIDNLLKELVGENND